MNSNNKGSAVARVRGAISSTRAKAYATGGALMASAPFAFASGGDTFDPSAILSKITENTGTAVGIVGALILGAWTLRSMGLLRGRG